jgi:hypothetical protein
MGAELIIIITTIQLVFCLFLGVVGMALLMGLAESTASIPDEDIEGF